MGAVIFNDLIKACQALGIEGPYSFEPTGEIWTGTEDAPVYQDAKAINAEADNIKAQRQADFENARTKLQAVGLTDAEIDALLGA